MIKLSALLVATTILCFSCRSPSMQPDQADSTAVRAGDTIAAPVALADKGVRIDYTDSKKGDTVLLFVHGWAINKSYWAAQQQFFTPKYRVVTIDLPGYGASGKNRDSWTVTDFGRDVDSVMTELDLHKVILVGHSMSGDIVLEAALHGADRVIGVVGIDNFKGVGIPATPEENRELSEGIKKMKKNFFGVASSWFNQQLFSKATDSALKKRILNDLAHTDSGIAVATMEAPEIKEMQALRTLHKPIYLINASYQPTDTSGLHKAQIPFHLIQIDRSGHFPMVEQTEAFNKALEQTIGLIATKTPSME